MNNILKIEGTTLVRCNREASGRIDIPNSVTEIGKSAFEGCTGLTSIEIPNNVTKIGESAFYGCTGLTSIKISNSVTKIVRRAFEGCTGLTSIKIPNSVTEIGDYAFAGCKGLTSIEIPNSVTTIGWNAIKDCSGLKEIHCRIEYLSNVLLGDSIFDGIDKSQITVYVPIGAGYEYRHHPLFQGFKKIVTER